MNRMRRHQEMVKKNKYKGGGGIRSQGKKEKGRKKGKVEGERLCSYAWHMGARRGTPAISIHDMEGKSTYQTTLKRLSAAFKEKREKEGTGQGGG